MFDEWRDYTDEQSTEHDLRAPGSGAGLPSHGQQVGELSGFVGAIISLADIKLSPIFELPIPNM